MNLFGRIQSLTGSFAFIPSVFVVAANLIFVLKIRDPLQFTEAAPSG